MAQIINTSANRFCSSPITVSVTAGSPANATFQRVRLRVKMPADVADDSPSARIFEFSTPATAGLQVVFDIASAFRAFADSHQYQPDLLNVYPNMSAAVTACDDYLVGGQERKDQSPSSATVSGIYSGMLTDRERIGGYNPMRYSRKPVSSPELCFVGFRHLHPVSLTDGASINAPAVTAVTVASGFSAEHNIYGIPAPADGYELRFINRLGVHENVFLAGMHTEEVGIQTDRYVISRQETLAQFSRGISIKSNDRETWHFSTPPLDRQWQRWYIHELLTARWAWLGIPPTEGVPSASQQTFLPVHILPEETIEALDRTKADMLTVPIVLEFDINGCPFD